MAKRRIGYPACKDDLRLQTPTKTDKEPVMTFDEENTFLTTRQVAQRTNTSESYWEKLRAENRGPKWVRFGRAARMRLSELNAWINSGGDRG